MSYINHYSVGSSVVKHRGKLLQKSNSQALDNFLRSLEAVEYTTITIPAGLEHRPDQ
jgi:hypothetical protein